MFIFDRYYFIYKMDFKQFSAIAMTPAASFIKEVNLLLAHAMLIGFQ